MDGDLAAKIAVAYWKSTVRLEFKEMVETMITYSLTLLLLIFLYNLSSQINGYADRVAKYNAYKEQLLSGELKDKQDEARVPELSNAKFSPAQVQELEDT